MGVLYKVIITPPAEKDLRKIDKTYHRAILSSINRLKANSNLGKPLRHELQGNRRSRTGRYRVIYKINHPAKTVWILLIDHRKDVYR